MKVTQIAFCLLVLGTVAALACQSRRDSSPCNVPVAPGVIIQAPSVDALVRDQYGRGEAMGASLAVLQDGAVVDSGYAEDTLHLVTRSGARSGTFTVRVSKPFYRDVSISNVVVKPDECGTVRPVQLPVVLELAPGAPAVRSVTITGAQFLWAPGAQATLGARVDADPGVSTAVLWRLADSSLATIDASGLMTATCTTSGGTERVTAIAAADTAVQGSALVGIAPAKSCS